MADFVLEGGLGVFQKTTACCLSSKFFSGKRPVWKENSDLSTAT